MKKSFRNLALIFMMIICFGFLFTACSCNKKTDNDIPNASDRVYGNGGLAVTKGDYLYFLNGYRTYSDITNKNDNKGVVRGAIYKTKLSSTGMLNLDEDGNIVESAVERVVDRIACFENGGLYLVGNYIYYATPNTQDNNQGQILNNYVNYCRVSLNDTSKEQVLYTSDGEVTNGKWSVYEMDGSIYLVIYDGSKLVCVKNDDKKKAVTMASDVTSVDFWDNEDAHSVTGVESNIYYTRDVNSDDEVTGGNIIAKVKIGTNNEKIVGADNSNSYTIFDVKNNNVYYKNSNGILFVSNANNFNLTNKKQLTYKDYSTNTYVVDNQDSSTSLNRVVVYTTDSGESGGRVSYFDNGNPSEHVVLDNVSITILDVVGNYIYYLDSNTIYRVDILKSTDDETRLEKLINGDNEFNFNSSNVMSFDVDNNYLYVLNGYTVDSGSCYYLERIDLSNPKAHTFIGEFVSGEKPAVDEEE